MDLGREIMLLFFLFYASVLFGTNPDSLQKITEELPKDTIKVNNYIKLGGYYESTPEKSIEFYKKGYELSREIKYLKGLALCAFSLGSQYHNTGNYNESFLMLIQAKETFEKIGEKAWTARTVSTMGESYRATEQFENALETLNRAMKLYEEIDDKIGIALVTNRISAVYFEMGSKDPSYYQESYLKAEESNRYATQLNDWGLMVNNYNILGAIERAKNNFDKSIFYLKNALEICSVDPGYLDKPNILNNIAWAYFLKGSYKEAINYALKSYKQAEETNIKIYISQSSVILKQSYEKLGDYKEAFKYSDIYANVQNEIMNADKTNQLLMLQAKYESKIKEEEIKEKEREIVYRTTIIIVISILAIFIVFFFVWKNSEHKKKNKKLKELNEAITKHRESLIQLNKSKDKFFSIIAHDLRNPFSGLSGFSDILLNNYDDLDESERKEYIKLIHISARTVFNMLENLLKWAGIQTGKLVYKPSYYDVSSDLEQLIEVYKSLALKKEIKIVNNIGRGSFVYADKAMLQSLFNNLISNAIKFSNKNGNIILSTELCGNERVFTVSDTGVGMTEADTEKIFGIDTFFTKDGTDGEKGSGLGLVISKEIVEINKGKIQVKSSPGIGTTFTITLPANREKPLTL